MKIHLSELIEEIYQTIKQHDWAMVVRLGALLYRATNGHGDLAEVAHDLIGAALFLMEHPVFECASSSLAKVMITQLEEIWQEG